LAHPVVHLFNSIFLVDNENAKKQNEEIIDKLRSELTEKEAAVSAKSESLEQEQQQLFENGRVSYDISKVVSVFIDQAYASNFSQKFNFYPKILIFHKNARC
jgi:ribosomal protein L9